MNTSDPQTLAQTIAAAQPPPQAVAIWWLGQASVVLRAAATTIYIDPFFSAHPERLAPPLLAPTAAPPADYVLCTHEHIDHFDPPTLSALARSAPHARFIVPEHLVEQVSAPDISAEHVSGMQPGEVLHLGALILRAVPACHGLKAPPAVYSFDLLTRAEKQLYRYLGYILEIAGVRIYHAGDTIIYDGLVERLREQAIDVAFLPINGRSYFREQQDIVGNMDEREAADLAAAAGVKLLVPLHYDLFAANLGRPGVLVEYVQTNHRTLSCLIPAPGRRFTFVKGDGC